MSSHARRNGKIIIQGVKKVSIKTKTADSRDEHKYSHSKNTSQRS